MAGDVMDEGAAEGASAIFKGPKTDLLATRESTKDNSEGTVTLGFNVPSDEIPADLIGAPDGSAWELEMTLPEAPFKCTFVGIRQSIKDLEGGKAVLRFAVYPAALPPQAVYGRRKEAVALKVGLVAKENTHPFMQSASQRHAVMVRIGVMTSDPEFGPWIADQCRQLRFPVLDQAVPVVEGEDGAIGPMDPVVFKNGRTLEHLYRVARIHSRSDVLDSNAAAGRVEDVVRRYRAFLGERNDRIRRFGVPDDR